MNKRIKTIKNISLVVAIISALGVTVFTIMAYDRCGMPESHCIRMGEGLMCPAVCVPGFYYSPLVWIPLVIGVISIISFVLCLKKDKKHK